MSAIIIVPRLGLAMFVVQSSASKAAKKMSILMGIFLALTGSWAALLTLHIFIKPSPPPPKGFRIVGFARRT